MESKQWYQSKRFWAGVIALLTAISVIVTGEKSWEQMIQEIILAVVVIVQTILGITSNSPIAVGSKILGKKK